MSNPLKQLTEQGQAVWLDFVSREFLGKGELQKLIERDGLTGVTSNPSIFEKAMGHGSDYDASLEAFLEKADAEPVDVYEHLAIEDIQQAADILRPVYDRLEGRDGYVSLEVSPYLALDTRATLEEARRLWQAVDRPNLMVKVPGTPEGAVAIRKLIEEGINVNVTLLFDRNAYMAVAEAYIAGLETRLHQGKDISRLASVASFFISRVDGVLDKLIDERKSSDGELAELRGKIAIANAKLAYQDYLRLIQSPRWKVLEAKGAHPQRLLWASTGSKDPAYPDTLYVDQLIGPDTVNTMPPKTMDAFRDHGTAAPMLSTDIEAAQRVVDATARFELDLDGVAKRLVRDGARQFEDAADALLGAVGQKRLDFLGERLNAAAYRLPHDLHEAVEARLDEARREGWSRRLWQGDASLWTGRDEDQWVGWLAAAQGRQADPVALGALADAVRKEGLDTVVLLGMGGSSLGPEVLANTLGTATGGLNLKVLDSTDPAQITALEEQLDLHKTLFLVSSKSGSTLEPEILRAYFHQAVERTLGADEVKRRFVAITDPGSKLEASATAEGYRAIFQGDPHIGGRYSVLSVFGMVPLALLGHSVADFFQVTQPMVLACSPSAPPAINPGIRLGVVLGEAVRAGRDKVTLIASPGVASLGAWLEQLLAESTGKQGKGIIPVDLEPLGAPDVYGTDRLFVSLVLAGEEDAERDSRLQALAAAGHPVVDIRLARPELIGQEFFRWEVATEVAGAVIGINPFDQPDVEASKIKTRALTDGYERDGRLAGDEPLLEEGALALFGDADLQGQDTARAAIKAHLARLQPGDYLAVLAYLERNAVHEEALGAMRDSIRDSKRVATVGGFGPRFLHSTGQAYKGGPNSGVFIQITADAQNDLEIPGRGLSFGVVEAAQAKGDLEVLAERGRRYLRVHIKGGDIDAGLQQIVELVEAAVA